MTDKPTPAPWKWAYKTSRTNNIGIYDANGCLLASLDVHLLAPADVLKRRAADARLMASAPALLDRVARTNSTCLDLVYRLLPHWQTLKESGDPKLAEALGNCIDILHFTAHEGRADIAQAIRNTSPATDRRASNKP